MKIDDLIKISVCIIARNEERYIEQALKSVIPVAYEIIVLDTGSTDRTKEIVRAYCNTPLHNLHNIRLYETTWEDDFAKARNECISYATGDWILSIDADEVLTEQTQQNLLPFLEKDSFPENTVLCFKLLNPHPETMELSSYYRNTMFKKDSGIYFAGAVHEYLKSDSTEINAIDCLGLEIYHTGNIMPMEQYRTKRKIYQQKLMEIIREKSDDPDIYHYYFHLGNTYLEIGEPQYAFEEYLNSFEQFETKSLNKYNSFYGDLLIKIISVLCINLKNYHKALKYIKILLEISPGFPDALFFLAFCKQNSGKINEALAIYEHLQDILIKDNFFNPLGIISFEAKLKKFVMYEIGQCYMIIGDKFKGEYYLNKFRNDES